MKTFLPLLSPVLLSTQQTRVVELLARGNSRKEIADRLGISTNTVHCHLKKVYAKTGSHSAIGALSRLAA